MLRSLRVFALASFLMFGLTACDTTTPDSASAPDAVPSERSASKSVSITLVGPRQIAPGQECTWAAIVEGGYGRIDWYKDFQEKIGTGAYYIGSFDDDTELEVKVYDGFGNFLNSEYFNLDVCQGCEVPDTECTTLTPVPAPL